MATTPLHVIDNRKSDFSAHQEIPDDATESDINTMSEAVSVNTLAAFMIGSRSQAYSHQHQGLSEQSVSPRTAFVRTREEEMRRREEEASFLRQREEEISADIAALNQFIFQAGNLYQGQRLTENEEVQLRDAAEHVGLSMEVVDVLLRHMADPNAMVNYCLKSDDGFARKFKDDPNFTRMMEEGSLSGGFDLSSSVWRVFLLRIVQQFLNEHYMELGDVMHTSSLSNKTYDEVLKKVAEKSDKDNPFAQLSNSMRNFTEERKHVSIDLEEAKKARLVAQVTSTTAPIRTFREVLEQGDLSSHIRQPQQVSSHGVHTESRDDDLDSRPGRFPSPSDELSEARTAVSGFSESRRSPERKSGASEWGQTHTSTGEQIPGEEENCAPETELSDNSDEGTVSAFKRGLAMFGKGAPSTRPSISSKPGGVKRTKSASRLSSALAIFEKENQGTVQKPQFDSAKSVGPEFKPPSKWSRKIQETACESKSVGPSPSKKPKQAEEKAEEARFDSRNAMQMFGPSKINEPQAQGGKSNAVSNNGMGKKENSTSVAYHHVQCGPEGPTDESGAEDTILGKDATEYLSKYPGSHSDTSSSEAPSEGAEPLHRKPDDVYAASGDDEFQVIYSSFTQSSDLSDGNFLHSNRDEGDTKAFRPRKFVKKTRRTQRNRSYQGTHKHDSKTTGFAQDGNILPAQDTESRKEVAARSALQGWTNFESNNAIPTYGRYGSFAGEANQNVLPFAGSQSMNASCSKWEDPLPQSPTWHGSGIHALESKSPPNASFCPGSFQDPVDDAEAKRVRMIEVQLKQQWNDIQAKATLPGRSVLPSPLKKDFRLPTTGAKTFTGVQEFSGVTTPSTATVITNASSIDGWVPFESREQKSKDAGFDRRRGGANLKESSVEKTSSGGDGTFPSDEGSYDDDVPGRRQMSNIAQIRAPTAATDGGWAQFEGSSLSAFDSKGCKGGSRGDAFSREAEWKYFGLQAQDKSETAPPFIPSDTEKTTSQSGKIKVSQRIKDWGKQGLDATPKGGEKLAHYDVSQAVSEGRDNGRMQPSNPTEPIEQSCYGREDFSFANSSTVHRHANPHRREPLHQEEWSSFPENSWRNQPSHLKAGSAYKGLRSTVPEQNREEPPPNEPGGTHGSASNQQSEWNHAPLKRKTVRKGAFDLDDVCKSRSMDPARIKLQSSKNTEKTDVSSAGSDSLARYGRIRMDKAGSVRENISGHGVLEVRSISTIHNQYPLPSHSIQGKCGLETRDHPNAQQKRHYQSKESMLRVRSETSATYPTTEQGSSLGDWSPGHWQNEENRNIKRLRTDEYSQSRASSFNESDLGLNSIDNLRDERSQENYVSGLNPIQATGTQTTESLSPGSDFNAMNFYEPTNGPPESAFRAEQKDKPPVHRKELKELSLFTNSEKDLKAQHVHGSDRDGPHLKKGFHHTKPGLNRSNRVEAHFSRIGEHEMQVQETPQEYYGRGTMKYSNPADGPSFPNKRIPGLHGEREVRNDRPTHQPTSEGGNLYDQHSSVFHNTARPGYNIGTTAVDAFPHHKDDGSQTDIAHRQGCEDGAGVCGKFIETSHRPLNGRAPAQPDIEWIAFNKKDHTDSSNPDEAQPARSAKAEFDALNAFLDEFQYDGKPLKVKSTRHGPPPDLVENRSSSTLSCILGVSTDHEGKEEIHDLERSRRREDDAPSRVVYPNRNQQLNSESDLEDRRRKDKYANVNSASELTASGSDLTIDEAELRAAAELSGIPLDVVDVVLAQAKRSQPDVLIPGSSRKRLEKGQLSSSNGSIDAPNRKTGYQVIDGEVVDDTKGDKGVNPSIKSWETAEAMDDCNFGTPRAASTNPRSTSSPCMPEGKTPVRKDLSPTHFRSPEDISEDQEPEGATEEEIKLLNRFIEVAASNFDGKRLSAESETRVRAAALKVGLSAVFVDQLIQQANDENNKNKQFEPRSTKSYPHTPNTQASRTFEITRAEKEARKANAAAETSTFASGCQFWESLTQNLKYLTKCGDGLDDASSVGLMSAPTLSWEEDAAFRKEHPPRPRTPAEKDGRRGYV